MTFQARFAARPADVTSFDKLTGVLSSYLVVKSHGNERRMRLRVEKSLSHSNTSLYSVLAESFEPSSITVIEAEQLIHFMHPELGLYWIKGSHHHQTQPIERSRNSPCQEHCSHGTSKSIFQNSPSFS